MFSAAHTRRRFTLRLSPLSRLMWSTSILPNHFLFSFLQKVKWINILRLMRGYCVPNSKTAWYCQTIVAVVPRSPRINRVCIVRFCAHSCRWNREDIFFSDYLIAHIFVQKKLRTFPNIFPKWLG